MCREHSTGKQVGLAHVIKEAADVSIETGIDAVQILRLGVKMKKFNERLKLKHEHKPKSILYLQIKKTEFGVT